MSEENNTPNEKTKVDEITKDPLLDHDYDGIKELDNPLPKWWLFTFYITMVFAVFYTFHFHLSDGKLPNEKYAIEVKERSDKLAEANSAIDTKALKAKLESLQNDSKVITRGGLVFGTHCAVCHGKVGEGSIGPNLVDKYWIHEKGELESMMGVVQKGILAKGMPAWNEQLSIEDQMAVVIYVKSLEGTTPANPKAPQGNKVE